MKKIKQKKNLKFMHNCQGTYIEQTTHKIYEPETL